MLLQSRTVTRLPRPIAALLALLVALASVAPLQAARCQSAAESCCPLMRGAAASLCHRVGAIAAPPMDCCKTKGATAPAPAAERAASPAALAVLPAGGAELATAIAAAATPPPAEAGPTRAAAKLHQLGLFTLLEVFRN